MRTSDNETVVDGNKQKGCLNGRMVATAGGKSSRRRNPKGLHKSDFHRLSQRFDSGQGRAGVDQGTGMVPLKNPALLRTDVPGTDPGA